VSGTVVVEVGVEAAGQREVRGLEVGASESEPFWIELLRGLHRHGLRGVNLVASTSR
jgi:putative transposase